MKSVKALLTLAALLGTLGPTASAQLPDMPERGKYALTGANVIPMIEKGIHKNFTVIVDCGKIVEMGLDGTIPITEDMTVVDVTGKYIVPGYVDMHIHLPKVKDDPKEMEEMLFLLVANGITTARGMLGDSNQLEARDEIAAGDRLGPRLLVSSPKIGGREAQNIGSARNLVLQYVGEGYDHIKVHEYLKPEVYGAIVEECAKSGVQFGGHVSDDVGLDMALNSGQSTIDHLDNVMNGLLTEEKRTDYPNFFVSPPDIAEFAKLERMPAVVEKVLLSGAAMVPTMLLFDVSLRGQKGAELTGLHPETKYLDPTVVSRWTRSADLMLSNTQAQAAGKKLIDIRMKTLKALSDAGVPILVGTDSPQPFTAPGFSYRYEIDLYSKAGLSTPKILYASTLGAAEFYGADDWGGIGPEMRADFVVLNDNPFRDFQNMFAIEGVMLDGRWLDRALIDRGLTELQNRAMNAPRDSGGGGPAVINPADLKRVSPPPGAKKKAEAGAGDSGK